jgi:hypothetical protein
LRRKFVLPIAAAAVLVIAVVGALLVFGSDEGSGGGGTFTDQAEPALGPVKEAGDALADKLDATEEGKDVSAVGPAAGELEAATRKGLDKARDLDSTDPNQRLLVDFLEATNGYAQKVHAASAKLTFKTASAAEDAARKGKSSRDELQSADGSLPLPGSKAFSASEQLSDVAKSCGGVPPDAIAIIGDGEITRTQLAELVRQATTNYRLGGGTLPIPVEQLRALRRSAVDFLVTRIQFSESAKELGVTVTTAEVKARLAYIKKKFFGSEAAFKRQIESRGLTEEQVENDVRNQLIQKAVYRKVSAGYRNKNARRRAWALAMQKRFARKTVYRVGYGPPDAKTAPAC